MHVDVTADALEAAIQRVAPVIARATTLPVLACVLLEAGTDGLHVSGTNLDVGASTVAPADVRTPGAIAVPARRLHTVLRSLARRVETAGGHVSGTPGIHGDGTAPLRLRSRATGTDGARLEIAYGPLRARLRGRLADEFPAFPVVRFDQGWRVTRAQLQQLIQHTAFAVSTDESRPILRGVLWELRPERTRMVATDGHRLARMEVPAPESAPAGREADLIVPPGALDQIRRLFPTDAALEVARGDDHLGIRSAGTSAYTHLVEGPYPNYEQVILKDDDRVAVADRERMALGIRRMNPLDDEPTGSVWLTLGDGHLRFGLVHPRVRPLGGMTDQMAIDYRGAPLDVGFPAVHLLDALHHIATPAVRLRLGGPDRPVILEPEMGDSPSNCLYLAMPLRPPDSALGVCALVDASPDRSPGATGG